MSRTSTTSSALASSSSSTPSNPRPFNAPGSQGVSSTLYLITFLVIVLVLGLISGALLFRARYIRRRFQRRVEDAIRAGQPLPPDAAAALGLARPRGRDDKEGKVGPMPVVWEAEMWVDRKAEEVGEMEKGWTGVVPLSILQDTQLDACAAQAPPPPNEWNIPPPTRRLLGFGRSRPLPRPAFSRNDTAQSVVPPTTPSSSLAVPEPGSRVTVGVLIALPFEETSGADRWVCEEEDGAEVPEVCLGVMRGQVGE